MFSYRHAFHVGNHADVLKHVVQVQLLRHLARKDAAFWVIDTHAGAGLYALDHAWSMQRAEFADGIGRLWSRPDLPPIVSDYVDAVRALNPDGGLLRYPGSPFVSLAELRADDRLRLFELHSSEYRTLLANIEMARAGRGRLESGPDDTGWCAAARRTIVACADGFVGLKGLLPPPPRRALVLIDPPYEDKHDYRRVRDTLADALRRFATGVYAIWYPLVPRREPAELVRALQRTTKEPWLHATLAVRAPPAGGQGLYGSGMFVINPPWTLEAGLRGALPWLMRVLARDDRARWTLQTDADRGDPRSGRPDESRFGVASRRLSRAQGTDR